MKWSKQRRESGKKSVMSWKAIGKKSATDLT